MRYFASKISDHLAKTPNGYLVCSAVPIARTGLQEYKASEIGVEGDSLVNVYRDPAEVFAPATIASFEGMTFTDTHPPEFVGPHNDAGYHRGHVQNVRRGARLDTGEEPLLADIIVKDATTISKIENGTREISCGYDCEYEPMADGKYAQKNIRGNHIALVANGRAGDAVRILDAKEERPVNNLLKHILGLGLKTYAKDAEPEEVTKAAEAVKKEEKREEDDDCRGRDDDRRREDDRGRDDDRKAKDDDREKDDDRKGKDKKAKDDAHATDNPLDRLDRICDILEKHLGVKGEDDDKIRDDDTSKDADLIDPVETMSGKEIPENPIPGADKALDELRGLKPFIAKSRDAAAIKRYNAAVDALKGKKPGATKDGYQGLLHLKKPQDVQDAEARAALGTRATDGQAAQEAFVNAAARFHRKNVIEVGPAPVNGK